MIERQALYELERWEKKANRKPMVIRGARQVGKSTLVRQFARKQGLRLFEVNLERHPRMAGSFASLDPGNILQEIEYLCGQGPVRSGDSVIFLDEIQGVPQALQSLRYFHEECPELRVIAAGSLLEFALANHSFPMPVGRIEYFHLGPLQWEEFLAAMGAGDLLDLLRNFQWGESFPATAEQRLLDLLRQFFLVGGMPEAVQMHANHGDLRHVFEVQESIVQTYRDDFSKYAHGGDLLRLHRILDHMGHHLGEKVKFSNIDRESQSRELRKSLDLILKAGIIFRANHTAGDGLPLQAQQDERVFKLYFLDLSFLNRAVGLTILRESQMIEQRFVNEGKLAEQFIAQSLYFREAPTRPPSLNYWLREGRSANAEVDFLVGMMGRVVPVEVKSGKVGTLKSLVQFVTLKQSSTACRFDLNPPLRTHLKHRLGEETVTCELVSLPLYLVGQVGRLLEA